MFTDIFDYDGSHLIHKDRHRLKKSLIGKRVGCIDSINGYVRLEVRGVIYLEHRIIWAMHNGVIPDNMTIDHINGNRSDNRLENLRIVPRCENQKNLGISKANSSGINGVSWDRLRGKWKVSFKVRGKYVHVGRYDNICDAEFARNNAADKLGFHPMHGKRESYRLDVT